MGPAAGTVTLYTVLDAIPGATLITFRLGVDEANIVAKEMGGFTAPEILNLELGQATVRAGGSTTSFNLTTYPPPPLEPNDPTWSIIDHTCARYSKSRLQVEAELQPRRKNPARSHAPPPSKTVPQQKSAESPAKSKPQRGRKQQPKQTTPAQPPMIRFDPSEDDLVT